MPTFPRQLKLGGDIYTIRKSKALIKKNLWGLINTKKKTIKISPSADVPFTLMHEIVHAVDDSLEIQQSEEETDRTAKFVLAFIVDNKQLLRWFLEVLG